MSHDDFAVEPQRGLPELLPEGERILWQGAPKAAVLAAEVFHWRVVACYFALLMLWRGFDAIGNGLPSAAGAALSLLPVALIAIGLLWLLAIGTARTTVYTLTDKRVVMRVGLALSVTLNLPLSKIGSASIAVLRGGAGNIVLVPTQPLGLTYVQLWPHVRPFARRTEPMLRGIGDAAQVGALLRSALVAVDQEVKHSESRKDKLVSIAA